MGGQQDGALLLAKELIYELLPDTEAKPPPSLQRQGFSVYLLDRLNHDEDSPLRGMVHTPIGPGHECNLQSTSADGSPDA
jgi:hypothetical protein